MDSVENVRKATSPFDRISDEITSCNCDEARRKLKKGDHIYVIDLYTVIMVFMMVQVVYTNIRMEA